MSGSACQTIKNPPLPFRGERVGVRGGADTLTRRCAPPSPASGRGAKNAGALAAPFLALTLLAGCAVGPDYQRPAAEVPSQFKELAGWKAAEPQPAGSSLAWWAIFGDPVLDGLERQVEVTNQNVKAAEAAYRAASAVVDVANAGLFPTVSVSGAGDRSQFGGSGSSRTGVSFAPRVGNQFSTSLGASWALDLWGRVRRQVEGAEASAQASAADLAGAQLLAQASLASSYFSLRAADELKRLLDTNVEGFTQTLQITRNQYAAGVASMADVAQAETQLKSTQAQSINVGVQRAQLEHAIAILIGKPPAGVSIASVEGLAQPPQIPVGLPSALLERRPDIASAERRMASANAQIGVAVAAYYPALTLSGSYGFASPVIGQLLTASSALWSFGASAAETVFDGGLRGAQVAEARATYDQEVAVYRQTVLAAFQQVEDELATARILAQQATVEDEAVASSLEAVRLTINQYKAGTVAYTSVVTSQVASLAAQQVALTVHQNRLTAAVALIQALGGGWDSGKLPTL
jgi:NodT family efflux transporter outer membrane factor (OMF) lipoprotein